MKRIRIFIFGLTLAFSLGASSPPANAAPALTQISRDPYTNSSSQHRTQVEPDTFSYGETIVATFQSGRFTNGGASNIGWATSVDGGATWTHGFLPNTTVYAGGSLPRISDPSVAYDAKHDTWLINALGIGNAGLSILVSRSTNGGLAWQDPILVSGPDGGYDKNWIVCDNTASSPYYGNCYTAWDDAGNNGLIHVSVSSDGGAIWNTTMVPNTSAVGVQPLVLPNGTLVIPYLDSGMSVTRSTDGGAHWSAAQQIAAVFSHNVAGSLRALPLPSAEMDGGGKIYLVWQDCRFIKNCAANDLVMTTSTDGVVWSNVKRIPLDSKKSGVDHFIPGIAADPNTSGADARLALTYYYYDQAACSIETCQLNVGYATSTNGGATWAPRKTLVGPMKLLWLPSTTLGYMVGDYISTSFLNGRAFPVIAIARYPKTFFREAMHVPTNGLPVRGGTLAATAPKILATESDTLQPIPKRIP